ncbi:MAG: DUF58 domain-containing protein [Actinomycetota bacterium]|nr:DUF58 domain-containing protein [Actinomycetota bacterium]
MRPTASGWSTLIGGILVYAIGVILGYPELVIAAVVLLGLVVAAVVWVVVPPHLAVRREVAPTRVRRADASLGLVEITNTGRRRAPRLLLEDRAGADTVALDLPPLRPRDHHTSTYRLPTRRRGIYQVGPLTLAQTDPFGLISRRRRFGETTTLWVHPRSHPVPPNRAGANLEVDGPMDERAPEGTIAFQGLRPYVIGDDLRMVHWRTTARTGTLMVKKHVDTNRPQVVILLDDRRASYSEDGWFEEAVETAASLLEAALRTGAPVRLDYVSGTVSGFVPTGGRDSLDLLAGAELAGAGNLGRAVANLGQETGGSAAVLVSGENLSDSVSELDALSGRYRRVSALLVGTSDTIARKVGGLEVCQAQGAPAVLALWQSGTR